MIVRERGGEGDLTKRGGGRERRFEEMRLLELSSMEVMCSRMKREREREREGVFILVKRELREIIIKKVRKIII